MYEPNKVWCSIRYYDRLNAAYLFCDMEPQDKSKTPPVIVQKMKEMLEEHVDTYVKTGPQEFDLSESIKDYPLSVFLREDLEAYAKENNHSPKFLLDETILLQQGQKIDGQGLLGNPPYLNIDHPMHSTELSIAIEAWTAVLECAPAKPKKGSRKGMIEVWLDKNHSNLGTTARDRIATLVNPDKNGGCPPSDK